MLTYSKFLEFFIPLLAIFLINTEINAVAPAIPDMLRSLDIGMYAVQWIADAYMLAFASFILLTGRAGDIIGAEIVFYVGMCIFTVASFIGGTSDSATILIISRYSMGLGAALIWPNASSILLNNNLVKKGTAIGIFTSVVGLSIAMGPLLGGYLTEAYTWRGVFLINVPFFLVCVLLSTKYKIINNFTKSNFKQLSLNMYDNVILLILFPTTFIILLLILPSIQFKNFNFLSVILLILVLLFSVLKIFNSQLYSKFLQNKNLILGCSARLFFQATFMGATYIVCYFVQIAYKLTSYESGIIFLSCTGSLFMISFFSGHILNKLKSDYVALIGLLISSITYFLLSYFTTTELQLDKIVFLLFFLGLGYGIASPALLLTSTQNESKQSYTLSLAIYFMFSIFGNVIGIIFASSVLERISCYYLVNILNRENIEILAATENFKLYLKGFQILDIDILYHYNYSLIHAYKDILYIFSIINTLSIVIIGWNTARNKLTNK